jgi:hypothetical protein
MKRESLWDPLRAALQLIGAAGSRLFVLFGLVSRTPVVLPLRRRPGAKIHIGHCQIIEANAFVHERQIGGEIFRREA